MLKKANRVISFKSSQRIPKNKRTSSKSEQLEIDFGDLFKSKKLVINKKKPAVVCSELITNYLQSYDKIDILNKFLLIEINSARKNRKLGKLKILAETIEDIRIIKEKKEQIIWAEKQQKRHFQDRELTRELNEDISRYKDDISRLEKRIAKSISLILKSSYPKNFEANNIESIILRNYHLNNNNILFKKYNIISE